MSERLYLDWNATAPMREEARDGMLAAFSVIGNPSSVHAEGRAARALIERAREQVAEAIGAKASEVIFTSGATEAAALALKGAGFHGAGIEHSAVREWTTEDLKVDQNGSVQVADPENTVLQLANGESGVVQDLPEGLAFTDAVQGFGKIPFSFSWSGARMAAIAAHKIGGPKGVGALILREGSDLKAQIRGGGQELGRRAGTENIAGIAGFGAAAKAAAKDLSDGVWQEVEKLRDEFES